MQIDQELTSRLEAGIFARASKVKLGSTDVEASVMPASFFQFTETIAMLAEFGELRSIIEGVMTGEMKDAALAARLANVLVKARELRDGWLTLMQPACNVDLTKVTTFMFAQIAVEFIAASLEARGNAGWGALGKRLAAVSGVPERKPAPAAAPGG